MVVNEEIRTVLCHEMEQEEKDTASQHTLLADSSSCEMCGYILCCSIPERSESKVCCCQGEVTRILSSDFYVYRVFE